MEWSKNLVLEARQRAQDCRLQVTNMTSIEVAENWRAAAIEWEEKAKEGGMAIGMDISDELDQVVQDAIEKIQEFQTDEFVAEELVAALHNARARILRGELVKTE